ncbi:hypothetical protein HPS57_10395 [Prevotella sp. PINT]|uniref:tetratricopeptide repeat protein n=1 Tax=Palleniella intestinalis TaxID=2736291 RepID=UPI001554AC1A|nr:hypothetical protein [Palleniella intestinalis]NPD82377.1 hypothetical protein [Palleniella intestinalis]
MRNGIVLMVLAMLLAISSIACSERKGDSYTFTCAKKYFEICDYDKALEYAQKEVAENPKNGAAHAIIGSVYVFRGESVKALTALDKALSNLSEKDKKERAHALYYRSVVHSCMRDTLAVLEDLKKSSECVPDNRIVNYALACLYEEMKMFAKADSIYRRMLAIGKSDSETVFSHAEVALAEKRYDEVHRLVAKAQLQGEQGYVLDKLEMETALVRKDYDKALEKLVAVLEQGYFSSDIDEAFMELSKFAYAKTVDVFRKKAIENKEHSDIWLFWSGVCQMYGKDYVHAVQTMKRVADGNSPVRPSALRGLIECYERLDDKEQMGKAAERYLEIRPDNDYAKQKLAESRATP